jgi:hypothetical protein
MSNKKQIILQNGLTKKVKKAIAARGQEKNTQPVPNKYNNTLDDLLDDPDFMDAVVCLISPAL